MTSLLFLLISLAQAATEEAPAPVEETPQTVAPDRKSVLQAAVQLELAGFQKMLDLTAELSKGKGRSLPAEAKTAHKEASELAKAASASAKAGEHVAAWRQLREAWAKNAPAIKYVMQAAPAEELAPLLGAYLDHLGDRIDALAPLIGGDAPADATSHFTTAKALFGEAKEIQATGEARQAFAKAREAITELDLAFRAIFKAGREGRGRDQSGED